MLTSVVIFKAVVIFGLWGFFGPFVMIGLLSILSNGFPKRYDFIESILWKTAPIVGGPLIWLLDLQEKTTPRDKSPK